VRRWLLITGSVLVVVALGVVLFLVRRKPTTEPDEAELAAKAEAPPDLQKLRDVYAAGLVSLQNDDGAEAVRNLASFTFGSRGVEEYRLYYLANGYQLEGSSDDARVILAKLWRRKPRFVYADDASFHLGNLYDRGGDWSKSAEVYASLARNSASSPIAATARWQAIETRLASGDVSGALFSARNIVIHDPKSPQAAGAIALVRALTGVAENENVPLTPSERLERGVALRSSGDPQQALEELTRLESQAPQLRHAVQLQRGLALQQLGRYDDSNKVLEPLTSGSFKYAIPALRFAARNYAILSASIDPFVYRNVKERKKVGTVKVRVGKGKKRHTVTRPKYQTVTTKVKRTDLAKKAKKDEYERLSSERLKDLLSLPIEDDDLRLEALNTLIARAEAKNQDEFLEELVPRAIKIERDSDPALQHFWDKGWAAYTRGDLATAHSSFRFITTTYAHPNVRRQSEYWFARTIERQGQKTDAKAIYRKLAAAPYADLYAIHSAGRGAPRRENRTNPLRKEGPDWRDVAEKEMPAELQLAYELTALSSMRDAGLEIQRNARRDNSRFAEALKADVYQSMGNAPAMYGSLRKAWPQLATVEQDSVPAYFIGMYYPRKYGDVIDRHSAKNGVDPNLVRALILQESYYNPKAKSRVGATGLMQLMAPTAKDHARSLHVKFDAARLTEPEANIQLGTFHLRMLMNLFRGNTYLTIASYNAGQGNVMKWRRAAPSKPLDELLESIPFPETRNYVKRVTMLRSAYSRLTL
jgi:soluble lytic murein transglycosylase-like protein/TolA-binding protein